MKREYVSWYSKALKKNMEMLVFGHSGASILFFPARMGRFYDYENWRVIEALRPKIEKGYIQVFCVDSYDQQSFYSQSVHPSLKIAHHIQYEQYILNEVLPFIRFENPWSFMIAAGCSLGAYHAVNIALRHPQLFNKVVAMSGRYDLTKKVGYYEDLLDSYWDESVYFNMPLQYIPNLKDPEILQRIKEIEIVLVVGQEDILYESNRLLNELLQEKGIKSTLRVWANEMHRARAWRQMVEIYL
jgi:esterase/lipase superfamily enzyme